jgi:hypothetical protein
MSIYVSYDEPPVITINRKGTVWFFAVFAASLALAIPFGAVVYLPTANLRGFDGLSQILLFLFAEGLAIAAVFWIRARWVCVAVLDECGVIASTIAQKHELVWRDIIGVRTSSYHPEKKKPFIKFLLLLPQERCLSGQIHVRDQKDLIELLTHAKLMHGSEGQRLGLLKSVCLFLLGAVGMLLGIWWVSVLIDQWNNGVLFQGGGRAILLKLLLGFVGPIGGFFAALCGLYHALAQPILYSPGWREQGRLW